MRGRTFLPPRFKPRPKRPRKPPPRPARNPNAANLPLLLVLVEGPRGQTHVLRAMKDPRWRTFVLAPQRGLPARLSKLMMTHTPLALVGAGEEITRARVADALRALRSRRFAVGPTRAGGVWIIAARRGRDAAAAVHSLQNLPSPTLDDVLARLPALPAELTTV